MPKTSVLHVKVSDKLKTEATETLANRLTSDPETYDTWFCAKVQEALESTQSKPHEDVMNKAQALIDGKKRAS